MDSDIHHLAGGLPPRLCAQLSDHMSSRASPFKKRTCMMSADILPVGHVSDGLWFDVVIYDTIMRAYVHGGGERHAICMMYVENYELICMIF